MRYNYVAAVFAFVILALQEARAQNSTISETRIGPIEKHRFLWNYIHIKRYRIIDTRPLATVSGECFNGCVPCEGGRCRDHYSDRGAHSFEITWASVENNANEIERELNREFGVEGEVAPGNVPGKVESTLQIESVDRSRSTQEQNISASSSIILGTTNHAPCGEVWAVDASANLVLTYEITRSSGRMAFALYKWENETEFQDRASVGIAVKNLTNVHLCHCENAGSGTAPPQNEEMSDDFPEENSSIFEEDQ
jgi:hypothetical protein